MTDDDAMVVQWLRERLAVAEPHAPVRTRAIRDLGRRKLRRRHLVSCAAAVAAVAAVAVGGALTAGTTVDAGPPVPPVDHARTFDPDALTSAIDRAVHTGGAPWEQRKLEARGQAPRPLKGPDRAAAQSWRASYTVDGSHTLEVWLVYEAPFDEARVRVQCAQDERFNDDCQILASTATSITQLSERVTYYDSGNWPVLENGVANLVGPIPVEHRWYMRTVKDFRSDGLIVMVREMVHAPTALEAAPLWLESTDGLTAIATNRELWFPPFPGAVEQGDGSDARADLAQEATPSSSCRPGPKNEPHFDVPFPTEPPYPTNANGQTYGSDAGVNKNPLKFGPELAAVVGDCGKAGFVYEADLMGPQPTSPADVLRIQRENGGHPRVLAVYEVDGTTQIDTFTLR